MASVGKAKAPGCLFWGCLTAGILALGVGGCTAFVLISLRNSMLSYTVEDPVPLPITEPTVDQVEQLQEEIGTYRLAVEKDQPAQLELTEADLNVLITEIPELAGRVRMDITEDQLSAQGSLPLDSLPGFSGRYLNGSFSLDLSLENETLLVTVTDFDIEGKLLSEQIKQQILEGLPKDVDVFQEIDDPELTQAILNAVDRLEVKDGKLIVIRE